MQSIDWHSEANLSSRCTHLTWDRGILVPGKNSCGVPTVEMRTRASAAARAAAARAAARAAATAVAAGMATESPVAADVVAAKAPVEQLQSTRRFQSRSQCRLNKTAKSYRTSIVLPSYCVVYPQALCALAGRTRPEHLCRTKCMRCR